MDGMTAQNELSSLQRPKKKITRQQIIILVLLCYGNFWSNACYSLIAPFYPKEAEAKGATPTQYGLILSVYQFMFIITAPIFAKFITCLSPTIFCCASMIVESLSYILFGFLIYSPNGIPFIGLSFLFRIISGIAATILLISSFTIVVNVFPEQPVFMTSIISTNIGLGMIAGPTIGGALYQAGGFILPFVSMGFLLMFGSILLICFLPKKYEKESTENNSLFSFILDIGLILDSLSIVIAITFIGFNTATLEPHLRQFNLKPVIIGCIFIVSGVVYGVTTLVWAKLCDNGWDPRKISFFGNFSCIIGLLFIGPQVFMPLDTHLWLIIVSLVVIGLGNTANLISSFDSILNDAINRRGFPDNISTYGMISACYLFSYSIGAIVGSSIGGFLLEKVGYKKATFPLLVAEFVMVILLTIYILRDSFFTRRRKKLHFDVDSLVDPDKMKN